MIKILRLGHRAGRDDRISTHVGLVARQYGSEEVIFSGERDEKMLESIRDIVDRWGGKFTVNYEKDWKKIIKEFEGLKIHLTMYGEKINDKIDRIKSQFNSKDILIIVGSEKVPKKVYKLADYNISVGNQPHSEIAALAVFLDRLKDKPFKEDFKDAEIRVRPSKEEKVTEELKKN